MRQSRTVRPSDALIAFLVAGLLALSLSSCTVSQGIVKDVRVQPDKSLKIRQCDLVVYLALYGLIATEENCHDETRS